MEIDAAVQQLVEKVLLREEDSEAIRASVCPRVEQLLNSTMLPLDGTLQLSGSFLRGTALSPLHDVDFLLPLVDGFRMCNGTKRNKTSSTTSQISSRTLLVVVQWYRRTCLTHSDRRGALESSSAIFS